MATTPPLVWGILGTGNIARQFAAGIARGSSRSAIAAVGSRSAASAAAFAQQFAIPAAHGSYDAVLADPAIEAVYISLPNSLHHEWTLRALRAGKHVLCEKPFAMNAAQAQEMFDVAQQHGRVLAEAFMYRSHPQTLAVIDALRSGAIGTPRCARLSFCYRTRKVEGNVRFDKSLGGGVLMDIGCYCVSFARLIAGEEPSELSAFARFHQPSGVDELLAGTLGFPGGFMASFTASMVAQADNAALICGDEGYLQVPWPWKPTPDTAGYAIARGIPPKMDQGKSTSPAASPVRQEYRVAVQGDLYGIEADDFAQAVRGETPVRVSREETLGNMRALDALRKQIGLRWEGERQDAKAPR